MSAENSLAEGSFVPIHGVDQWISIRGADRRNPVVLILGGPGAALSVLTPLLAPWEQSFTLVQWDQPGAGSTYAKHGEEAGGPLTFDRLTRDAIAVTEHVSERFGGCSVIVLAFSGGTVVGLQLVRERLDLVAAYVGSGQIVAWRRQLALSYEQLLAARRAADDSAAVAELTVIGAPPYPDATTDAVHSKYAGAPTPAEQAACAAVDPAVWAAVRVPPEGATYVAAGLTQSDPRQLAMAAYIQLRDELAAFDAYRLGLDFAVPMLFLQGELDVYTVTSAVVDYEKAITAPHKELVIVPGGGHSAFLQRDVFLALLERHVRPLAAAATER